MEEPTCDVCGRTAVSEEITNSLHRANQLLEQARTLRKEAAAPSRSPSISLPSPTTAATGGHLSQSHYDRCLEMYGKSLQIFRHTLHQHSPELMAHLDEAMSTCIGITSPS